ncbi:hypothetical protein GCM10008932_16090 [Alkalibacterium iburiense]|uniref:Uncharacterized protein n=1 Tax=Alkalibacterium iburiense TaxID=290589 RepID=A0ABN0XHX7_9LACT
MSDAAETDNAPFNFCHFLPNFHSCIYFVVYQKRTGNTDYINTVSLYRDRITYGRIKIKVRTG